MKTTLITTIILLVFVNSFGQQFQGIAYYTSKTQLKDFNITSNDLTPEMKEQMMEKMKKAFEKTYILSFSNSESVYQEEEKLETPNVSGSVKVRLFSGSDRSKLYKNLKEQQYVSEEDIFGKEFLITDSLQKMNWKMMDEQKKIGEYTCYKAQLIIPVSEEDWQRYEANKQKKEVGKTTFLDMKAPKESIIEAWYTLDIPVANGPAKYWGLPGLILELHEENTIFLCTKIIINPKDKIEIKAPKNGKEVSQKEFNAIQEKKLKSMMNEDGVIEIRMN